MKHQPIIVSALLTTHLSDRHLLELLNSLLKMSFAGLEIIIIDDAASEELSGQLHEMVQTCDNDLVFLLDHEQSAGRGNCLNEAMNQASGKFIWAPQRADRFNENLFRDAFRRFKSDPAAVWVMDYNLPKSSAEWIEDAENGRLPDDSCFVWNRDVLQGRSFFFNPFLTHLHGAELAMRINGDHVWHRTDPFFVIDDHQFLAPVGKNFEEFIRSVHRSEQSAGRKANILDHLMKAGEDSSPSVSHGSLLTQCRQLLAQEDAKNTLRLIDTFLKQEPDHYEALQIKIAALEKLRRHVEAAELKHDLKKLRLAESMEQTRRGDDIDEKLQNESLPEQTDDEKEIAYSVVVPTTGVGKHRLERCLNSLAGAVSKSDTELIIIDNASIDDTFDYLDQLKEKQFLNIRVITNSSNAGFGASVNQGLDAADGDFVMVLHNDVEVSPGIVADLTRGFDADPRVAIVAPVLDQTQHAAQIGQPEENVADPVVLTDIVDSCCFMVKCNQLARMDTSFGLAYFEMEDYCRQVLDDGGQIAVSSGAKAIHHEGSTTKTMGFKQTPQRKWANRALLHHKWTEPPAYEIPSQGTIADRFERLEPPIDPSNPPNDWQETVLEFLTDEIRTEILRSDLSKRELMVIVPTLLMADCRELLRTLEDRLDNMDLPPSMLLLFVNYYFEKNIYSRCHHYLDKAGQSHPAFDLFRLKIHIADKEIDDASALLAKLIDKYPASPDLFALAARLYEQAGDRDEANSFAAMANQLDPLRYPPEESAFEVKF
ncbi:glycosyltransferase [Rhodohalobacter sp. 8-1]|uniref:glycosyltransferase n=1 Tax=Rhodohalobacter sp. 8-1 TaxID=3131972 RepID=UPI0030EB420C